MITVIVVEGVISIIKTADRNFIELRNRFSAFQNNAPFTGCILKINRVLIDNPEYLDAVINNLLQHSKNYIKNNR